MTENQVILVEGERITAVGPADNVQIPSRAQLIDLSKATLLPGLIDGHTHIFGFGLDGIKSGGPPFASPINDTGSIERCWPWQMPRKIFGPASPHCGT